MRIEISFDENWLREHQEKTPKLIKKLIKRWKKEKKKEFTLAEIFKELGTSKGEFFVRIALRELEKRGKIKGMRNIDKIIETEARAPPNQRIGTQKVLSIVHREKMIIL